MHQKLILFSSSHSAHPSVLSKLRSTCCSWKMKSLCWQGSLFDCLILSGSVPSGALSQTTTAPPSISSLSPAHGVRWSQRAVMCWVPDVVSPKPVELGEVWCSHVKQHACGYAFITQPCAFRYECVCRSAATKRSGYNQRWYESN